MSFPYLTSNLYVKFPFTEDATLKSVETIDLPINFFADAVIDTTYSISGAYLKSITSGDVMTVDPYLDFRIVDLSAVDLMTFRIRKSAYTPQGIASAYSTKVAIRLVFGTANFADLVALIATSINFLVTDAKFSEHVFTRGSSKVLRIKAESGPFRTQIPIRITAGNNVLLEKLPPDVVGGPTKVRISAVPGAGAGVVAAGASPIPTIDYVATLGGVRPDARGNVTIQGDDCYRAQVVDSDTHAVQLFNDCSPCCQCDDYEKVASEMAYAQELNTGIKDSLLAMQTFFNQAANSWNGSIASRRRKIFVTTTILPQDIGWSKVSVTIMLLNNIFRIDPPSYTSVFANLSIRLPGSYEFLAADAKHTVFMESDSTTAGGGYLTTQIPLSAVAEFGLLTISLPPNGAGLKPKKYASVIFTLSRINIIDGYAIQKLTIKDVANGINEVAAFKPTAGT